MYRKFKADGLFNGTEMLGPDAVLITTHRGKIVELVRQSNEEAEKLDGVICPGFVNAHCHIELSHLKGKFPKHTGLVSFVQQVMLNRAEDDFIKKEAMQRAEKEMVEGGIVAVGDICNTTDSHDIKKESSLLWRNFVEVSGFVDATARKRLDEAEVVKKKFQDASIVPHAPYSVSRSLFEMIAALKEPFVSIHNQESKEEDNLYRDGSGRFLQLYENLGINISSFRPTGKSSFISWLPYFSERQHILSVHNTFIAASDIEFFSSHPVPVWFCICPNANLFIENALPPVDLLRKSGCRLVLGTDSYASNEALSIVKEIQLLQEKFPHIALPELLNWATSNGAEALGFDGLGNFNPGSCPGIVLLDTNPKGILTGKITRIF